MAKKVARKEACPVCNGSLCRICTLLFLIAGILFLLQDLGVWAFWNLNWYTVAFLLIGLGFFATFKK